MQYKRLNKNKNKEFFDSLPIEAKYKFLFADFQRVNRYCTVIEEHVAYLKEKCKKADDELMWLRLNHEPNHVKTRNVAVAFVQWLKKRKLIATSEELDTIDAIKEKAHEFYSIQAEYKK